MEIILGPPGTGKTTKLLNIMDEALSSGIKIDDICFISFTKRAIKEARTRVKEKFDLQDESIKNFRTLHSFAFRYLGLSTKNLMSKKNFAELADILGIEISGIDTAVVLDLEDAGIIQNFSGDKALFLDSIARNKGISIKEAWELYPNSDIDFFEVEEVMVGLKLYKQNFGLLDYTDILQRFVKETLHASFDLLLVDEAQDLSELQWKVVDKIRAVSKQVYVAGDDDQAIFRWAGADVEKFISLPGNVHYLTESFRLPKEVHAYSKNILKSISNRRPKEYTPGSREGAVEYINELEELDFSKDTWLILGRSTYNLMPFISYANELDLFYSFKDRGINMTLYCRAIKIYIRAQHGQRLTRHEQKLLEQFTKKGVHQNMHWSTGLELIPMEFRLKFKMLEDQGENFFKPRIQFSTIHGAKGTEADNVVICPDLAYKAYSEMLENPEDEARVFYVGVTRAKSNLYILTPQTSYYYDL